MTPRQTGRNHYDILLITILTVLLRVAFHMACNPWESFDSKHYIDSAQTLIDSRFDRYDAIVMPGYPLFLGAVEWISDSIANPMTQQAAIATVIIQSLCGVLSSILLYLGIVRLGIRRAFALPAALLFASLTSLAVFELGIMSESLSVLMVILSFYLLAVCMARMSANQPFGLAAALTGLTCGLSALVRLNNLVFILTFLGVIMLFALLQAARPHSACARTLAKFSAIVAIGTALPVAGCLVFTHTYTGVWTLSFRVALNRSFMAYNLFDKAPPQDRILSETLQRYYELARENEKIFNAPQDPDDDRNVRTYVLKALPELYLYADKMPIMPGPFYLKRAYVMQYIGDVATRLLLQHRDVWFANGVADIPRTLDFDVNRISLRPVRGMWATVGNHDLVADTSFMHWLKLLDAAEQPVLLLCYLLTGAVAIVAMAFFFLLPADAALTRAVMPCALATAAIISMIAPCFTGLYCPRYGIPFYSLFIASTAWLCMQLCELPASLRAPQGGKCDTTNMEPEGVR